MTDIVPDEEGNITLPFRPSNISWAVKPIWDTSGDVGKWLLYLELYSDSAKMGAYLEVEPAIAFLNGTQACVDHMRQQIEQEERERKLFSENGLRARLRGLDIPPSIAEVLWANINADDDDGSQMPLPFDETKASNNGRRTAPEEG